MRSPVSKFLTLSAAVAVVGLASTNAFALAITNGTTATVNDGVYLDASPGIQTNAFSRELSINDPDNTITFQGKTNPGVTGPTPVYTNDPAKGNVTLADLPVDNAANPLNFQVHFNPNEPAAPSKKSVTVNDVLFASAGTIIWDYDEKTYGALQLDGDTFGGKNNHSDLIFNLPIGLFQGKGLTGASPFEIFWTVSDNEDTGTPEQWAVIPGTNYSPNTVFKPGPIPPINPSAVVPVPAGLGLMLTALAGFGVLRRLR